METTEIKTNQMAITLDKSVEAVITNNALGFEKAYVIATAIDKLKSLLTPDYMKPIMSLQNQSNGFKTDELSGYGEQVVKKCLIDAVLIGVQPYGNHFNIIKGNTYITKEGFGYLLKNYKGLSYEIIPSLPRISKDGTSAAIVMKIKWSIEGKSFEREIDFAVKCNAHMGADGVIGKATRKARAWLYGNVTGTEMPEGDTEDVKIKITSIPINKEAERIELMIADCKSLNELEKLKVYINSDSLTEIYEMKFNDLSNPA